MIMCIPRMIPACIRIRDREQYTNMETFLQKYLENCYAAHIAISLYMNRKFYGKGRIDKTVIGLIKDINNNSVLVDIEDKEAYTIITQNEDIPVIRIVSLCTKNPMEYGMKVTKILRFELDFAPKEDCLYAGIST